MGAMTASIAHEINQPLAAIVTNGGAGLRWLSGNPPNLGEARDVLNPMVDDARRASQIIAGVRAMFTKDTGELAPLDINDVVRDVLVLVHGELQGQHVAEQINLFGHPLVVRGNRVQLQQVLLNLFMNAIEAMSSVNDRPRTLSVNSAIQDTNRVLLMVCDSGPGINPADLDRVFDAFFTSKPTGMGMGLAICRSIIEAHGGRLWASQGHSGGAAFHMTLPLELADRPAAKIASGSRLVCPTWGGRRGPPFQRPSRSGTLARRLFRPHGATKGLQCLCSMSS